jgi:hypothetical protein
MSFIRHEILLPTRYNDGSPVESVKFDDVLQEISERFGGVTFFPETLRGVWLHQGQRFDESNVRLVVDVEDSPENADFFVNYKRTLKDRFRQIDLWIVSYQIRIV